MNLKTLGVVLVAAMALGIVLYKSARTRKESSSADIPRVLLVADLREADAAGDACAEIIHLVRAAHDRGVSVRELTPESKSELLARYRVLTVPTVLVLARDGTVESRYEGESRETVAALRAGLTQVK
jgi:hypothetical protein